jgi:hypothetical protein
VKTFKTELDAEVINSVQILNSIRGVETLASCSGHGYNDAYISMICDNWESLIEIVKAVNGLRYSVGDKFDVLKHCWYVEIGRHERIKGRDYLILAIRYQQELTGETMEISRTHLKIKMEEAWKELENSLKTAL